MWLHCKACNIQMTNRDLFVDDELCQECLNAIKLYTIKSDNGEDLDLGEQYD